MNIALPVVAGAISTAVFALSALPMLVKAARTKDMRSYSLSNILLSNVGNVFHSIYVVHLPVGPVWVLHSFYLVSTGLMLVWYLRYAPRGGTRVAAIPASPDPRPRALHRNDHVAGRPDVVDSPDAPMPTAS